ncbi:MAG TPA: carbamoyl-phosphate synthase small subunit, partial [Actinobacteria bacterium]|nr:carbamoyl-phosphate synthase small subunit [Actinomycetota bacterium]
MTAGALVLADGTVFSGIAVGADGIATGEIVFNTAMTGYQEIVTDPSYAGQIVAMTSPHIGNYGVSPEDDQALHPYCTGLVTRSMARRDSNWRSTGSFRDWLENRGVVSLTDIDTRRLARHVRDRGAMPAAIGTDVSIGDLAQAAREAPSMANRNLCDDVTTAEPYRIDTTGDPIGRVVAIDLGIKRDILRSLAGRGLQVYVVPATTPTVDVLALNPSGVFLSNGPGDPEPLVTTIETVRGLLGNTPVFGICLGHQVLGLALGATTYKLPFGHHGGNHPVRLLGNGRVEITAQNHGFAVDLWSLTEEDPPIREGLPGPHLLPRVV